MLLNNGFDPDTRHTTQSTRTAAAGWYRRGTVIERDRRDTDLERFVAQYGSFVRYMPWQPAAEAGATHRR